MSWFRASVRRLGRALIDWADGGVRIHMCSPPPPEFGVSWGQMPESLSRDQRQIRFIQLGRGDKCGHCGEVNA